MYSRSMKGLYESFQGQNASVSKGDLGDVLVDGDDINVSVEESITENDTADTT